MKQKIKDWFSSYFKREEIYFKHPMDQEEPMTLKEKIILIFIGLAIFICALSIVLGLLYLITHVNAR